MEHTCYKECCKLCKCTYEKTFYKSYISNTYIPNMYSDLNVYKECSGYCQDCFIEELDVVNKKKFFECFKKNYVLHTSFKCGRIKPKKLCCKLCKKTYKQEYVKNNELCDKIWFDNWNVFKKYSRYCKDCYTNKLNIVDNDTFKTCFMTNRKKHVHQKCGCIKENNNISDKEKSILKCKICNDVYDKSDDEIILSNNNIYKINNGFCKWCYLKKVCHICNHVSELEQNDCYCITCGKHLTQQCGCIKVSDDLNKIYTCKECYNKNPISNKGDFRPLENLLVNFQGDFNEDDEDAEYIVYTPIH